MKLGLFGGGFKPFTTGHFAKLANAIRDNDKVYLFYGIQSEKEPEYYKRGSKKGQEKPDKRLRPIGATGRLYTPGISKEIFDIYESAIERELPSVEVESTIGSTPIQRILDIIEEFALDPDMYDKITIYGDGDTLRQYIRSKKYFKDLIDTGKVQLGAIPPDSPADYLDEEKLLSLIDASEKSALDSLRDYYPDLQPKPDDTEDEIERKAQDIKRMQQVRGTEVRGFASTKENIENAKRFLPAFLNNEEKERIIELLLGNEELNENQNNDIRAFIQAIIRG